MTETPHGARTERPTILVVDDEVVNRDLVCRQLREGYRVLTAESGQAALDLLDREIVDLVLMDVMMPVLNGYETCARIKQSARDGFLPVILLTALNQQQDRNEGLATGADDFLVKPVNSRELRLRVREFLRIREQDRTIRAQLEDLKRLQALKDDLVSLIVHDLRNPLAGMEGYLKLLHKQAQSPSFAELSPGIEKVLRSTGKLRSILEGVLQVRLLEEGRLPLELEEVDLGELAADAVATVEGAGKDRRISLEVEVEGEVGARLDRALSRRAVENLLSNALRHAPSETTVSVRVRSRGDGAEIAVEDRGPGIPDDLKAELFEKFGSVEERMGSRRTGFGLGLHLVKLVMQAHEGRVVVADREGGGARFELHFPSKRA
jgi:signal transduction histidine kinase